jgi:hypothetical protein
VAPLAELLRSTITGTFEKLIQPAGLVPAAVLVLFNLGFIVPAAKDAGIDAATAYTDLSETWRAVVAATAILLSGLVFLSAAQTIIGFYSGYGWRLTLVSAWLLTRERRRAKRFATSTVFDPATKRWELERRFDVNAAALLDSPDNPVLLENVQPTALGNVLRAVQRTVSRRHGFDLTVLANHIDATKEMKDSRAAAALQEERVSLDLFCNLAFALALFGIEATVFFSLRQSWSDALSAAAALGASYLAYRIAVGRARSWADALEALVDLHADDLATQLKLRTPQDAADRNELWTRASRFYRPGEREDPHAIFDPPDQHLQVIGLNLEITQKDELVEPDERTGSSFALRALSYTFVLSRPEDGPASLVLRDARLAAHAILESTPQPQRIEGPAGSSYVWEFAAEQRPAGALAVSAALWTVRANNNITLRVARLEPGYFRITSERDLNALTLEAMTARPLAPRAWRASDELAVQPHGGGRRFTIALPADERVPLYVRLPSPEQETPTRATTPRGTELATV